MDRIKEYVYDFVEGRITVSVFLKTCKDYPEILAWVQSVVPSTIKGAELIKDDSVPGGIRAVPTKYNVYRTLNRFIEERNIYGELGFQMNVLGEIAKIMSFAFPDSPPKKDMTLSNLYSLILECCPSYIGGIEVERSGILEEIIHDVPKDLSKTAGKKWVKDSIKERFHIEGRHYPYWIQEPEWPMEDGEPMEYVRTEHHGVEGQTHYFRSIKTGTERAVEDWH